MIYSVFDYYKKAYDYFEAPGTPPATGKFRAPGGKTNKPECLAVKLPFGAVHVGVGALPRGCVAATDAGLGALESNGSGGILGFFSTWFGTAVIAAGAYFLGRRRR